MLRLNPILKIYMVMYFYVKLVYSTLICTILIPIVGIKYNEVIIDM